MSKRRLYKINGPLDLTFLMKMYGMEGFDDLKDPEAHARSRCRNHDRGLNIFDADPQRGYPAAPSVPDL